METKNVWIVSVEWNQPPSEVTGDTGIVGVFADEAKAKIAAATERRNYDDNGTEVFNYSYEDGSYCGECGEACDRSDDGALLPCKRKHEDTPYQWCEQCGAELTETGSCNNDHDEWEIDIHVTEHTIQR